MIKTYVDNKIDTITELFEIPYPLSIKFICFDWLDTIKFKVDYIKIKDQLANIRFNKRNNFKM
jgi:hypothetical protein